MYMFINIIKKFSPNFNGQQLTEIQSKKTVPGIQPETYIPSLEEPDIVSKLKVTFLNSLAFFNEIDLYQQGIEAFTQVLLKVDSSRAIFVVVPVTCLPNGTVALYEEGLSRLKDASNSSRVEIIKTGEKIPASKIWLHAPLQEDSVWIQRNFSQIFKKSYIYGFPFVFSKYDTVSLSIPEELHIPIWVSGTDQELFISYKSPDLRVKGDVMAMSLPRTSDSTIERMLYHALDSITTRIENISLSQIEKDSLEASDASFESSFRTSTPRKSSNDVGNSGKRSSRKKKRSGKIKQLSFSTVCTEEPTTQAEPFYWMSKESIVQVVLEKEEKNKIKHEPKQYFKMDVYYSVKNVIERKMIGNINESSLQAVWSGILLTGLPGTGKTALIKEISSELNLPLTVVSLLGWSSVLSQSYVNDCFNEARSRAPAILLFDEVDALCHANQGQTNSDFSRQILKLFQKSKTMKPPVVLIGTTNRLGAIPASMRQVGRFDKEFVVSLPDVATRTEILKNLLGELQHSVTDDEMMLIARSALGFSGSDLSSCVRIAWQTAVQRWKKKKLTDEDKVILELEYEDLEEGTRTLVPCFLREKFSAIPKQVEWSDIWGYDSVKERLKRTVRLDVSNLGLKGILLYGPPGCSKTMMVRALASDLQLTFLPVKCSTLLSKYVGETEKLLCALFERATQSAPTIIFMDEIDSLCGRRSGKGTESGVIPELLSLLRKASTSTRILVVGATNRPQAVDEALLSPGCLELLLHVDLPDCVSRCAIWEGLLTDVPKNEISSATLCSKTNGYSCAEICGIYQRATHILFEDLHMGRKTIEDAIITEEIILTVIAESSSRVSRAVLDSIRRFRSNMTHQ